MNEFITHLLRLSDVATYWHNEGIQRDSLKNPTNALCLYTSYTNKQKVILTVKIPSAVEPNVNICDQKKKKKKNERRGENKMRQRDRTNRRSRSCKRPMEESKYSYVTSVLKYSYLSMWFSSCESHTKESQAG